MNIMGILNVTPDSFSDGGNWNTPLEAIRRAEQMWADGADIIDVGGESTRPGSTRIGADEEWARISPVLPALIERGMVVSVDTIHAGTARRAVDFGAAIINDVSGGCFDPRMNQTMADSDARVVIQHWRGFPGSPDLDCEYGNPVLDSLNETLSQVERAMKSGVRPEQIIVDPGLGFALTGEDSWKIVENLQAWTQSGYPVLVGGSRKRFVRERFGDRLEEGTELVTRKCLASGVWAVRVHDVCGNRRITENEVKNRDRGARPDHAARAECSGSSRSTRF